MLHGAAAHRHGPIFLLLILGTLCVAGGENAAAEDSDRAKLVKAAIVLNIARFVIWPDDSFERHPGQVRLCFYRHNPFGAAVDSIRGKKIGDRRLEILVIASRADNAGCNLVFVPPDGLDAFRADDVPKDQHAVLTITDLTASGTVPPADAATLIVLYRDDRRVGFQIDLPAAKRAGLRLGSELLKLARIVGEQG